VLAAVLFYSLQRYIIYGQDGLTLAIPFLGANVAPEEEGEEIPILTETVVAEIEFVAPDFSEIRPVAPEGLTELRALYVPANAVNEAGLAAAAARLEDAGANALVLEMKTPDGNLSWFSTVALAADYGVNGTLIINELLAGLKEDGVYLVAALPCCVDSIMASRNSALALRNSTGNLYADRAGNWLDPYSQDVRAYVAALGTELFAVGFDEILLSYVAHPEAEVVYSRELSAAQDRVSIVSSLALALTEALRAEEGCGVISAQLDPASLRAAAGTAAANGQDAGLFWKLFDRVWSATDGTALDGDRAIAAGHLGGETHTLTRYVPILPAPPEEGSWLHS